MSTRTASRWRPYPAYKDSGVEWLGNIPSHWDVKRAKFLFEQLNRPVREEDGIVTCFRDGQVTLRSNRRTEGFTFSIKEIGYQGVRKGDLVIHAMDAFAGAVGVSESDGKCSPVYAICRPRVPASTRFYGLLIRHMALSDFITSLSRGIRERSTEFRYKEFKELLLPIPPLPEQRAIAAFVDRETARIDALIDAKQRLIALLHEKRAALISHAVTKGLDPSAPMRDSGIPWLGEIPAHWEVAPVWTQFSLGRGRVISHEEIHGNPGPYPVYSSQTENQGVMGYLNTYDFEGVYITWTTDGAKAGTVFYREGRFNCTNVCGTLKATNLNNGPRFVAYALDQATTQFVRHDINPKLMNNVMAQIRVQLPPLHEQYAIAAYLDHETAKLDALIAKILSAIEALQEYRTALISAAVTGKIDVRGEV